MQNKIAAPEGLLVPELAGAPRFSQLDSVEPQKERPTTNAYLSIQSDCTHFDLTTSLTSIYIGPIQQLGLKSLLVSFSLSDLQVDSW